MGVEIAIAQCWNNIMEFLGVIINILVAALGITILGVFCCAAYTLAGSKEKPSC